MNAKEKRQAPFTVAKVWNPEGNILLGVVQFFPVLGGFRYIDHVPGRKGSRVAHYSAAQALPWYLKPKDMKIEPVLPE